MTTETTKHTPGPWKFDRLPVGPRGGGGGIVVWGVGGDVNPVALFPDGPRHEANARLIAAAPEMAAALRDLVKTAEDHGVGHWPPANDARALLRRIEGERR